MEKRSDVTVTLNSTSAKLHSEDSHEHIFSAWFDLIVS